MVIWDDIDPTALADDLDARIGALTLQAETIRQQMHPVSVYVQHDQKRLLGATVGMIQLLIEIREAADAQPVRAGSGRGSTIDTSTMTNAELLRAYWEGTGQ